MLTRLWADLAQVVAPRSCVGCGAPGTELCRTCGAPLRRGARRADPSPRPAGLPPTYAAAAYEAAVRSAVVEFKEHGRTGLLAPLADALAGAVAAALVAADAPDTSGDVVLLVPVPSSPDAARARDTRATVELARAAAGRLRAAGLRPAAGRSAAGAPARTRPGSGPPGRCERRGLDDVGAGADRRGAGRLDDVVTTGATLSETVRALRLAGADVLGCAVVAATARRPR